MPNLEQVAPFREYAERFIKRMSGGESDLPPDSPEVVRRLLEKLPPDAPGSVKKLLQKAHAAAVNTLTHATSPLRIGVVGGVKTGKSELLCSLIGSSNALPTESIACTGNITQLRFKPVGELRPTEIETAKVHYLSRSEVRDCLAFMLKQVRGRAAEVGVDDKLMAQAESLSSEDPKFWERMRDWLLKAWSASDDLRLRYLLWEMGNFIQVCQSCADAVCGERGKTRVVDKDMLFKSLTLKEPPEGIDKMKTPPLARRPPTLAELPEALNESLLEHTFPLIGRVETDVRLSQSVWDISSVQERNGVTVYDFPGLGNVYSSSRDEYLCLRQLREMHTILLLLNGADHDGKAEAALRIHQMMKTMHPDEGLDERIIVGVNRFDAVQLGDVHLAGHAFLDKLVEEAGSGDRRPPGLSEADVLAKIPQLRLIVKNARELVGRGGRLVFLSPYVMLLKLDAEHPDLGVINERHEDLFDRRKPLTELLDIWGQVSLLLQQREPNSLLGESLSRFAEDGGRAHLQNLISRHVETHGAGQVYKHTEKAARELHDAHQSLSGLAAEHGRKHVSTDEGKMLAAIRDLRNLYISRQERLRRAPLDLKLRSDGYEAEPRLRRWVEEELKFAFFDWKQWTALFENMDGGRIIPPRPVAYDRENLEEDPAISDMDFSHLSGIAKDSEQQSGPSDLPAKSDDFLRPFEETINAVLPLAEERLRAAVSYFFHNLSLETKQILDAHEVDVSRDRAEKATRTRAFEQWYKASKLGERDVMALFKDLRHAASPDPFIRNDALKKVQERFNSTLKSSGDSRPANGSFDARSLFPLPRADGAGVGALYYAWSLPEETGAADEVNHQLQMLHVRNDIVTRSTQQFLRLLDGVVSGLQEYLIGRYGELIQQLGTFIANPELVVALARPDEREAKAELQWWEVTADLLALRSPFAMTED